MIKLMASYKDWWCA